MTLEPLGQLFAAQQRAFQGERNPSAAVRDDRLARLLAMTEKHAEAVANTIDADFGLRSRHETRITEIFMAIAGIRHARRHLKAWMRPRRVPTALHFLPGRCRILRQPLGVIGIVSPWNYPFQLSVAPAIGAIAAGNRVMIKPSELTPRTSALLAEIVGEFFASEEVAVATGDAEVGKAFVCLPFDHLLFTGSTAVGRAVAQVAAKNLVPVTLELGGKSPAIVDVSCDLEAVATRLVAGKLLNAGQSCIAPDYLLVPVGSEDRLLAALRGAVGKLYPRLADNPDYSSIVSDRHFQRLASLLADAHDKGARVFEINPASETFPAKTRRMPLQVLFDVTDEMTVMQEEIFGPLLPVVTVASLDQAIRYVNCRPRPLALYWFGSEIANRDRVLAETISGGVTINDTLLHIAQENLPFGGVGASGQGVYHGEHGFLTFSQEKPVYFQTTVNGASLLYPPYGRRVERILAWLKKLA
jgi:coniferyl-aldehyde dehydrogenase